MAMPLTIGNAKGINLSVFLFSYGYTSCRVKTSTCETNCFHIPLFSPQSILWSCIWNFTSSSSSKIHSANILGFRDFSTGEKRIVPLHPFITDDLNFIGYVTSLPNQEGRVFPDLKRINHRYGHYLGKWFSEFKKRSGIDAPPRMKSFHSFRHTLINHLKQNDIPEHYIAEFVGHTVQSITLGRYGKKYKPDKLFKNVVLKLDYGIDLSHLKNSRFVIKDSSEPEV